MDATLHIRLNSNTKDELEFIAEDKGIKMSVVIREALEEYTDTNKQAQTILGRL